MTLKDKPPYWLSNMEYRVVNLEAIDTQTTQRDYVGGGHVHPCLCVHVYVTNIIKKGEASNLRAGSMNGFKGGN